MGGDRRGHGVVRVLTASAMAAATFGAVGCGAATTGGRDIAAAPKAQPSTVQARLLRKAAEDPPTPFVTDSKLVGRRNGQDMRLDHAASPALFGWTSPLAVPSPDGHLVAYSAWHDVAAVDPEKSFSQQDIENGDALGRPSVRVVDVDTGQDSLIEDGAFSVAWRADGALAYSKGDSPDFRANVPYLSDIVVRRSIDAEPEVWTTTRGRYIVVAWAGDTLLAYAMQEGEQFDLVALSGPGSARTLANDASLVAVSPDGTRLVISYANGPAARLLDVASGKEVARIDAEPASTAPAPAVQRLSYGGSWRGDRVVAETAGGLVVLHVSDSALSVERTLAMPEDTLPMGVHEPQFADEAATRVIGWAPVPGAGGRAAGHEYVYVDCDIADAACSVGPPRQDRVFSQTYNPSRPESHR